MFILSLKIRNYRNFKAVKLNFKKGINTIIGENGAGKSNLFYALRLLIDDSLPRYVRFFESDFNRSIGNWVGHWIIIAIEFEELDTSEEIQALAIQATGQMNTSTKGSYSLYFRPKYEIRKKIFDYSQGSVKTAEGLGDILKDVNIDDYESVFLCRGSGDFSDDDVYKKYVGDFDSISFPDPDKKEEQLFGTWLPREINILNEISCTFIKALRDVESDLKSYSNNPLISLMRGKEKSVEVSKKTDIITTIDELNNKISDLKEVKEIKVGIDKSIKEAVGATYAPNIDIKSELPNDMEKLFQSLKLWVGDPDDAGYKGRIWELSLGGANLIYLSLKLLEYEKVRTDRVGNFLLIEEPEAHIHTHIQKTLFSNLNKNRTQVIISTHSTHISSVSKISSVNILCRGKKEAHVFAPSNNLTPDEINRLERYLDAVRSTLIFAKGVILVEGDSEQILIPEIFKKVFGLSLDEIGISLINIGSTGFKNIARIFHEERIQRNCAILTDLDASVLTLPTDSQSDSAEQKHCRASQTKGIERKLILDDFVNGNKYLKPFYAEHTFEVDFIKSGNKEIIKKCVDKVYSQAAKISSITLSLDNANIEISGSAILEMANYEGKGWFAIMLAENISFDVVIPEYILSAISFSASHIDKATICAIAIFRLNKIIERNDSSKSNAEELKLYYEANHEKENGVEEFVTKFKTTLTNDSLTQLLNLL